MAGAAKNRANKERELHKAQGNGSSSGDTSSSGKASRSVASRSVHSDGRSLGGRSTGSRVGSRFDGNRDPDSPRLSPAERNPATARPTVAPKNIDLPAAAYTIMRAQDGAIPLQARPKPSSLGVGIKMGLNTFTAEIAEDVKVHQYDVLIGSGVEKRGLIQKVWQSNAIKAELGSGFIFDGNKLAWSLKKVEREVRLIVDLDEEEKRTPKNGKENKHRIAIRRTNEVSISALFSYMRGKGAFDNAVSTSS